MKIRIQARVSYVSPSVSHNKLLVVAEGGGIRVRYEVYDPTGAVRNAFDELFPAALLVPATMYALVEFWDGYTIIEHRPGTYDGIYGAHSNSHKATFAVGTDDFLVFTNTPVDAADNVEFIADARKFWESLGPEFAGLEACVRTRSEVAAHLDAHASIAAVEAQLDLLTSLVLTLFSGTDVEAADLREIITTLGVLNVKDRAAVLEDVKARKAAVRYLQLDRQAKMVAAEAASLLAKANAPDAALRPPELMALLSDAEGLKAQAEAKQAKANTYRSKIRAV